MLGHIFLKGFLRTSVTTKLLILVFLLGLGLRLGASFPGYPQIHPDEPIIQTTAQQMALDLNFKPLGYYYGSLLPLLYAFTYWVFYIPLGFVIFSLHQLITLGLFDLHIKMLWSDFLKFLLTPKRMDNIEFYNIPYWSRYDTAIIS